MCIRDRDKTTEDDDDDDIVNRKKSRQLVPNNIINPVSSSLSSSQSADIITLEVEGETGDKMKFIHRKDMTLRKLMNAYAMSRGVDRNSLQFLYDGCRLHVDSTPEQHEMENDDVIDALLVLDGC